MSDRSRKANLLEGFMCFPKYMPVLVNPMDLRDMEIKDEEACANSLLEFDDLMANRGLMRRTDPQDRPAVVAFMLKHNMGIGLQPPKA